MSSFKIIGLLVLKRTVLKLSLLYGRSSHLGHSTCNILTTSVSPFHGFSTGNLALVGRAVLEEKKALKCVNDGQAYDADGRTRRPVD